MTPLFSGAYNLCVQGYEAAALQTSNAAIIRQLGQYLLPKDNAEYKARIGTALVLLVASKTLNVSVGTPSSCLSTTVLGH